MNHIEPAWTLAIQDVIRIASGNRPPPIRSGLTVVGQ